MASQLTRLQIVTKAADMVGRSLTGVTRSGATHKSILDEMYEWGQLRLAREYCFQELDQRDTTTCDTTASTMQYSFTTLFGASARVREILSVVIEDGTSSKKLTRLLRSDLLSRYPYPEGETINKPQVYCRHANNLWFFPLPDATYDIHTVRSNWPTRATGDGSYSDYEDKDDIIVAVTLSEYFRHLQEKEEANYWDSVFAAKLRQSVMAIIHPTDWSPEGRAFNSSVLSYGDFWKDPLVMDNL